MAQSPLVSMITKQLGKMAIDTMAKKIGGGSRATSNAVDSLIPVILNGMFKNTKKPNGAEAFHKAVVKDHDGSVLEDLAGALLNPDKKTGEGILKHVLGNKRPRVENAIGKNSGLSPELVGQLATMLAPILMGMIGKQQRTNNLNEGGLADLLGMANGVSQKEHPKSMSMVEKLLDTDGDGDVSDDIMKMGSKFLTSFLTTRR